MHTNTRVLAVIAIAAFILPGVSFAQTESIANFQAEIQSLLAQVQTLEVQLNKTSANIPWCNTFNTNLSIGMSGSSVTALQTALQRDGEPVTANGTFDDQTAAAVTGFQEKYASQILAPYGLRNGTGYAGRSTRAELNSLIGCNTGGNPVTSPIIVNPVWPISTSTGTIPSSVTLTVNGQSGIVSANSGSQITLAWKSNGVTNCIAGAGSNSQWAGPQGTSGQSLVTVPSVAVSVGVQYSLTCSTPSGGTTQGFVQVNLVPPTTNTTTLMVTSPDSSGTFYQGGNNTISWSGGSCLASEPNSCVSLELDRASGSCANPTANQPTGYSVSCAVGWIPTPQEPGSGSYTWSTNNVCASNDGPNGTWLDCSTVPANITYRVVALDSEGDSVESGAFTILPSAPTSTISSPTSSMAEAAKQARDMQRWIDLSTLKTAILLYTQTHPRFTCQGTSTIYASVPITPPAGWVAGANMGSTATDGSGWIPIEFAASSGTPLFASLPVDPVNDPNQHLVYLYACNPYLHTFELDAAMESQKYSKGGSSDLTSTDGGNDPTVYEVGDDLSLIPDHFWGQ